MLPVAAAVEVEVAVRAPGREEDIIDIAVEDAPVWTDEDVSVEPSESESESESEEPILMDE